MPYPRRLLHDDEDVIFELRPHPIRLAFPVVLTAVVFAAEGFGLVAWGNAPGWFGIALAVIAVIFGCYLTGRVLTWRATMLVLTTSRVVFRTGIIRRIGREIPLDRVQDVTYLQRLGERLVGAGSVIVESAGAHGSEPIPDVRHPEWVQSEINAAIHAARNPRTIPLPAPTVPPPPSSTPTDSPAVLYDQGRDVTGAIEELADLHRRGVLTDAEFTAKKQELLGRL